MQHDYVLKKKYFWPIDLSLGVGGRVSNKNASMLLYFVIPFSLIWNMNMFKKVEFWHLLGKGWPLCSRLWCLLWVCHFPIGILGQVWYLIVSISDLCTLTYFDPIPLGSWGEEVSGQGICYLVAAFVIIFNSICTMTMFWKLIFDLLTPWSGCGMGRGLQAKYLLPW